MAYYNGNNNRGNGNYQNNGNSYNKGGYNNNQSNYQQQKPQFDLEVEASKILVCYLAIKEQLADKGITAEEVAPYLGGWSTSLKIEWSKAEG